MILKIINMYGAKIIGALLVTIFGILGMALRNLAAKYLDTPMKQQLAKLAVQFVEQTYKDLHGKDKLNAAFVTLSGMLAEKGIRASESEMTVLIEAAVAEFNEVFKKPVVME